MRVCIRVQIRVRISEFGFRMYLLKVRILSKVIGIRYTLYFFIPHNAPIFMFFMQISYMLHVDHAHALRTTADNVSRSPVSIRM